MLAAALSRNVPAGLTVPRDAELSVLLTIDKEPQRIVCEAEGFKSSIGPVPVLAIPDSRFLNRADDALRATRDPSAGSPATGLGTSSSSSRTAAPRHMLHALCLDYSQEWSFDQPIFDW